MPGDPLAFEAGLLRSEYGDKMVLRVRRKWREALISITYTTYHDDQRKNLPFSCRQHITTYVPLITIVFVSFWTRV